MTRRVLACETWRYMDGGLMVVRSALRTDKGRETAMFWFLERVEREPAPQRSCFGGAHLPPALPLMLLRQRR